MDLDESLRTRVLSASAATIDRLLRPIREKATGKKYIRPKKKIRAAIAVKTFSEWNDVAPGSLQVDYVAHCGGNLSGSFIQHEHDPVELLHRIRQTQAALVSLSSEGSHSSFFLCAFVPL
ncbi:hypothetical protein [Novipirellula aureliae]|nr:hypothetical protein [Novipirellula aureliae]